MFLFFKQKTAYEMRISDWSSDVCSSDLDPFPLLRWGRGPDRGNEGKRRTPHRPLPPFCPAGEREICPKPKQLKAPPSACCAWASRCAMSFPKSSCAAMCMTTCWPPMQSASLKSACPRICRSEEHTSDLQSLMRSSYAVFCLKKTK